MDTFWNIIYNNIVHNSKVSELVHINRHLCTIAMAEKIPSQPHDKKKKQKEKVEGKMKNKNWKT